MTKLNWPNNIFSKYKYDVKFMYSQGLRLNDQEISRLRNTDMKDLLCHRKLYLVLDLDHTLLNSTLVVDLNSEEMHLTTQTDSLEGTLY